MSEPVIWYDDLGPIADGGWGVVQKMRRKVDGHILAVKRINPLHCESPEALTRFALEADLLWKVQGHPNVIRIIQYHPSFNDGKGPAIVCELMSGTLLDRMRRGMRMQEKITAAHHLSEALSYAHSKGVIHRDVKPDNVLVSPEGIFKLNDFGCAKAPGFGIDLTRFSMGTETYMAPEQKAPRLFADERSDIHAFGVTLFHLFVGRLPVFNDAHELLQWDGYASTDRRFTGFIMKLTNLNPDLRFQSMQAVKAAFVDLQEACALPGMKRVPAPAAPSPKVKAAAGFGELIGGIMFFGLFIGVLGAIFGGKGK